MEKEKKKVGRPKLADKETKRNAIISILVSILLVIVLVLGGTLTLSNSFNSNNLKGTTITNSDGKHNFFKIDNIYDENKNIDVSFESSIEVDDGYVVLPKFYGNSVTIDGKNYSLDTNWFLFKYDINGKLVWKKVYKKYSGGVINHIVKLNDGFAVLGVSSEIKGFTRFTGDLFESEQFMLYYKFDSNYNMTKFETNKWHTEHINRNYTWGYWNYDAKIMVLNDIIYSVYAESSMIGVVKINANTGEMLDSRQSGIVDSKESIIRVLSDENDDIVVFSNYGEDKNFAHILKIDNEELTLEDKTIDFGLERFVSVTYDNQKNYIVSLSGMLSGRTLKINKKDFSIIAEDKVDKDYIYYELINYKDNIYAVGLYGDTGNISILKYNSDLEKNYDIKDEESIVGYLNAFINKNENLVIIGDYYGESSISGIVSIYKKQYAITSEESEYGKVTINNKDLSADEQINLVITTKDNYLVSDVRIINSLTNEDVTEKVNYNSSNNTFIMPGYDVKIMVSYTLSPVNTTTSSKTDNNTTTTTKNNTTTTVKNNATVVITNTNVTNPKTYDNVYVYVVLGLFGIVILVTSIIYFRKIRKK